MTGTEQFLIRLPKPLLDKLRKKAEAEARSINDLIRLAVEKMYKEE